MIDPNNVTKFDRTKSELEAYILFCACVAGKTAKIQSKCLQVFFDTCWDVIFDNKLNVKPYPFEMIKAVDSLGELETCIKSSKLGQYTKLTRCFRELANSDIDLFKCTTEELEKIHGIGFKTSRFFIVHSRKVSDYAILDTHILKYLRDVLNIENVPKSTPGMALYKKLEKIFVEHARENNVNVADLDLAIWIAYSQKQKFDITKVPKIA